MTLAVIVPGLNSSGPLHWQSWFETQISACVRVHQPDWRTADLDRWSAQLRDTIDANQDRDIVLVAHSFGVLASIVVASERPHRITGALLVAPADPDRFGASRALLAPKPLPFPAMVVGSRNDPWMRAERAQVWSHIWGARYIDLGNAGHINVESGFGAWPQGLALLEQLSPELKLRHFEKEKLSQTSNSSAQILRHATSVANAIHQ